MTARAPAMSGGPSAEGPGDRAQGWQATTFAVAGTLVLSGLALALAGGATPATRPRIFVYLFRRDEPVAAWLNAFLILVAVAAAGRFPRIRDRLGVASLATDPRAFIAAITAVCALGALLVYRAHPLSMDEYAPVLQAGAFARLNLSARVPAELVARLIPHVRWGFIEASRTGQMVSGYWPGFALLLTPFVWLGCPWLLNPLIGGASLAALWRLARTLWPGTAAPGWALLFAASSPTFVVNAMSYYSMPAHLLASLIFAGLLCAPPTRLRLVLAGLVGSLALSLHNPMPHTLFALPWIAALALRPGRIRALATLAAGYLPGTLLLCGGWLWVRHGISHPPGMAHGLSGVLGHLWHEAFAWPTEESLWDRAVAVAELGLWAAPGLLPLALLGAWRLRGLPAARLLSLSALLTFVAYLFVPYDQGHGWGYRYFHSAWGVLPLLAAGALEATSATTAFLRRTAVLAAAASLVFANGLRFAQVRSFIDGQLEQLPRPPGPARLEVVFVDVRRGYYSIDLVQNDPFMEGRRWILISFGADEDERFMRRAFPHARLAVRGPVASVWQVD